MIRKGDIFCNDSKSDLEKQKNNLRTLIKKNYEHAIKEEFVAENSNIKKQFEAELKDIDSYKYKHMITKLLYE